MTQQTRAKNYNLELKESITTKENIKLKQKREGKKRPIKEIEKGYKKSEDKKKYPEGVIVERIIDRENNKYREVVIDNSTEEIIQNKFEKLSNHK